MGGEGEKGIDRRGQGGIRGEERREGRKGSGGERWWMGGQGEVIMVLVIMLAMVEVVKKAVRWSINLFQAWDTN